MSHLLLLILVICAFSPFILMSLASILWFLLTCQRTAFGLIDFLYISVFLNFIDICCFYYSFLVLTLNLLCSYSPIIDFGLDFFTVSIWRYTFPFTSILQVLVCCVFIFNWLKNIFIFPCVYLLTHAWIVF